jgi:hypothetical protein
MSSLILKHADASRPSGEWRDDDYDVLADGVVVGRTMKAAAAPVGTSWMWTLAFGHYEDRTPTHGTKQRGGRDGGSRKAGGGNNRRCLATPQRRQRMSALGQTGCPPKAVREKPVTWPISPRRFPGPLAGKHWESAGPGFRAFARALAACARSLTS